MASRRKVAESTGDKGQAIIDKLERWTPVRVHRSKIVGAPYNPRKITDNAKLRLRKILENLGLLEPLVWNVRSGNLVGGHQRLKILDALAGTGDYELTVSQVDLSPQDEIAANIALNNRSAAGDDDLEKLQAIFRDNPGPNLDAMGLDTADVYHLFGDSGLESLNAEQVAELGKKTREYCDRFDRKQQERQAVKDRNDVEFYTVLVFKNNEDRRQFHEALGLDEDQYQDGRAMRELYQVRSGGGFERSDEVG